MSTDPVNPGDDPAIPSKKKVLFKPKDSKLPEKTILIAKDFALHPKQYSEKFKTYAKEQMIYKVGLGSFNKYQYYLKYYLDSTGSQRYVYLRGLGNFYISTADLKARVFAASAKSLQEIYKRDVDPDATEVSPILWRKIGMQGDWVECAPVDHRKIPDAAQIIHPYSKRHRVNYEATEEKWHSIVRGLDETHARARLGKKDLIARLRTLPLHRRNEANGLYELLVKTIHLKVHPLQASLTQDEIVDCYETACNAAIGKNFPKPAIELIMGNPSSSLIKFGSNIFGFYDVYLDAADFEAITKFSLEARGMKPDQLWRNYPTPEQAQKIEEAFQSQQTAGGRALDEIKPDAVHSWTFSANTIAAKVGAKRSVDQPVVMGDISATKLAELMKWEKVVAKDDEIPDGLEEEVAESKKGKGILRAPAWAGAAEWLHLSAFSYGGFELDSEACESQRAANLVFGSWESNTVMLRAEVAIQTCLIKESQIQAVPNNKPSVTSSPASLQTIPDPDVPTDTGLKDAMIDVRDPHAILYVTRDRSEHDSFKRLDVKGEMVDSKVEDWWVPKIGETSLKYAWFAPSIVYKVLLVNVPLRVEPFETRFDLFSTHRPLYFELCLDTAFINYIYDKEAFKKVDTIAPLFTGRDFDEPPTSSMGFMSMGGHSYQGSMSATFGNNWSGNIGFDPTSQPGFPTTFHNYQHNPPHFPPSGNQPHNPQTKSNTHQKEDDDDDNK